MSASVDDHYATLGVHRSATSTDIKRAYRELALKWHPDRNPSGSTFFKRLVLAYEVLSDDSRRRAFDSQWILRDGVGVAGFNSGASQHPPPPPRPFSSRPASAPYTSFRGEDRRSAKPFATGGFTASTFFPTFGYKAPPVSAATYDASTGGFGSSSSRPQPSTPTDTDSSATRTAADEVPLGAAAPTGNDSRVPKQENQEACQDSLDAVAADRAKASSSKRSESVSGYNISEEEQDRLRFMRERFDAAQSVDMTAWERIRNRPTSATVRVTSSATAAAAATFVADANVPTNHSATPEGAPRPYPQQVRPSSARPYMRSAAPPPKPPAQPEVYPSEPREQPAHPTPAVQRPPPPPAPSVSSPSPQHDTANVPKSAPPRPFSAGVTRHHRAAASFTTPASETASKDAKSPASTTTTNEGRPHQATAESPPPDQCAESLFVPSDSEVASMKGKELAHLIARLEKKLKVARQTALIGSFS